MTWSLEAECSRIHREISHTRQYARHASISHDSRALGRALRTITALERLEDSLRDICECGRPDCPGGYKPDGSHFLAF